MVKCCSSCFRSVPFWIRNGHKLEHELLNGTQRLIINNSDLFTAASEHHQKVRWQWQTKCEQDIQGIIHIKCKNQITHNIKSGTIYFHGSFKSSLKFPVLSCHVPLLVNCQPIMINFQNKLTLNSKLPQSLSKSRPICRIFGSPTLPCLRGKIDATLRGLQIV